jgi:Spy/CpxP family protein refolding chaperone
MDIFAQRKLLISTVIILIIINLSSICFFLLKDHHHDDRMPKEPNAERVKVILKQRLNLTEQQSNQMSELRQDFYGKEKVLAKLIRSQRDSMNDRMFNKITDEVLITSLARHVAENEFKMELLRFDQAKSLKAICTNEQLEKFEGLVKEIRDYFKPFNQNKK